MAAEPNRLLPRRSDRASGRPLLGIGTEADVRLSVHMLEHMIMWLVVAPLLAAGAPMRLAFYAMPRSWPVRRSPVYRIAILWLPG